MRMIGAALLAVATVAAVRGGWAEVGTSSGEPAGVVAVHVALSLVGLSWAAVGGILTWLRPRNVLGWLMLVVGTATQLGVTADAVARAGSRVQPARWEQGLAALGLSVLGGFLILVLLGLLPVLYPSGRLPRRRWRPLLVAVVAAAALMQAQWLASELDAAWAWPFSPSPESTQPLWLVWAPAALYFAGTLVVWVLCVMRLLRARFPERQLLAWLLAAVVVVILTQFLGSSTPAQAVQAVGLYLLPAAVAVGILRYRLLGIEVVLRRGLVYAFLTGGIVAVHALVAALTGARLTGGALPGVVAAAVIAVGVTPLRDRLQRAVDRFLYGRRSDPVLAVADLGDRVASAGPHELLDAVLAGVRDAFRAAGARVEGPGGEVLAADGTDAGPGVTLPLRVGGTSVGVLHLAPRAPGERYSPGDERLLAALAPQVAVVVRALALTAELESQRDAVVDARRAERERLRHELHDGLGPSLTGVGLGLQALDDAVAAEDRSRAHELTAVLRDEVSGAVTEVHRILEDLRPAPLAEHGLARALTSRLGTTPVPVDISVDLLPSLPGAVEDALYRVALEAVTNVVRHAGASRVSVDVGAAGGTVRLRVDDDGAGFAPDALPGVGMASMRQRATALGGTLDVATGPAGTTLTMAVPLAGSATVLAGTGP